MDRPIDTQVRRHRLTRRIGLGALSVAGLVLVVTVVPRLLRPTVERDRLRTARVEQGPIEATLTASGTVVPEVEQVIASPVDARVLRIRKRPGDVLNEGEAILDLDLSASQLAVQKLEQDLAIKQNQQAKTRLDLEARLADLEGQREVKALELGAQRARTSRDRELNANGFLSQGRAGAVGADRGAGGGRAEEAGVGDPPRADCRTRRRWRGWRWSGPPCSGTGTRPGGCWIWRPPRRTARRC